MTSLLHRFEAHTPVRAPRAAGRAGICRGLARGAHHHCRKLRRPAVRGGLTRRAALRILPRRFERNAMPYATTKDNVKLYYEEAGNGTPIVFVSRVRRRLSQLGDADAVSSSRRHRCITYSARGLYAVRCPEGLEGLQLQALVERRDRGARSSEDRQGALRRPVDGRLHGAADRRSIIPNRALSIVPAGAGSGSERAHTEDFRQERRRCWRKSSSARARRRS